MDDNILLTIAIITAVVVIGIILMLATTYRKAALGEVLVRTGLGGPVIFFSGGLVYPVLHLLERMDITQKSVVLKRERHDGMICKDYLRADIQVRFLIRVGQTEKDILQVANTVGVERASDLQQLQLLFDNKFSEALKTAGREFEFEELVQHTDRFVERILAEIGADLGGYVINACEVIHLELTDIKYLDENNLMDAEGIKKLIGLKAARQVEPKTD